jgi:ATP citrate (pro-S)-lyase
MTDVLSKYNVLKLCIVESKLGVTFLLQVEEGKVPLVPEITPPPIPEDLKTAIKSGKVRAPTHIISTISDDRG